MQLRHLRDFWSDDTRAQSFSRCAGPVYLDVSKQRIDERVMTALLSLADVCRLKSAIGDMMHGALVNNTEGRAALHTALRSSPDACVMVNGRNIIPDVHESLVRMETVVNRIHAREWHGYAGNPITDIVNIGVGGSDLGPSMVSSALADFTVPEAFPLRFHYVGSTDGTQMVDLLRGLQPETTLFIISSKSFTTLDTLSNANMAWDWMQRVNVDLSLLRRCHFIGVSANPDKMTEWGIAPENALCLWDWVGGRFSLWSAIGLPVAMQIGMVRFRELLEGARFMDNHFCETPFRDNLPVLLGMTGVWNASFMEIRAHAILPYDARLREFPGYLAQLEMESNGKSVTRSGLPLRYATCPVLLGEVGSNAQHAFFQLLHQGTQDVSSDFIAPVRRYKDHEASLSLAEQHHLTLANCFAQSRALMMGDAAVSHGSDAPEYRRYHGNQPSSTILLDSVGPFSLGALIALYEHKVFVMSVIWDINPFDQWGVELGKEITNDMRNALSGVGIKNIDPSTRMLLEKIMKDGWSL